MRKIWIAAVALMCNGLFCETLDLRIPVVDMNDYYNEEKRGEFLDTLFDAMRDVGFFAVRNTGVNTQIVQEAYGEAETFFYSDMEWKKECFLPDRNGQRGFVPGEAAKGYARKDYKEFYHVGRDKNVWPSSGAFQEKMSALYDELGRYVVPLQRAIIETINRKGSSHLPLDFLNEMTENGDTLLRALYYPKLSQEQLTSEPIIWAAAHTDIDCLAILPYGTEKGLQVEVDGQWLNVVVPSDAFVVNVGDMLENLTNGLFVSAKHRVMAQDPERDRFSMVLFVHPRDEAKLDPLPECIALTGGEQVYAPGTRQEFLWERLLELGIASDLLFPYAQTDHLERQKLYGKQSPQVEEMLLKSGLRPVFCRTGNWCGVRP